MRGLSLVLAFLGASLAGSNAAEAQGAPPTVTLVGTNPQLILQGGSYTELGATASDLEDGDLTGAIVVTGVGSINLNTPDDYTVTYTVEDSNGNSGSASRTVRIVANNPPNVVIVGANPQLIPQGGSYTELGATASDPEDGNLTGDIVVTGVGSINVNTPGDYTVTYTVEDSNGNSGSASRTVRIVANNPPNVVIVGANPQLIPQGGSYTELGATASDPEDGNLTGDIVVTGVGSINVNTPGDYTVTYTVEDSNGNPGSASRTVRITPNNPPTFSSTGPMAATEDSPYSYTMTANDVDGNALTFAAPTLPSWLVFNAPATISGTPRQAHVGSHSVVVTVSDGIAPAVQQSFTITVSAVNDATFTSTAVTTATQDVPYSYTATATDPDGDTLTLAAPIRPAWLTFTPGANGTGTLSGTPGQAQVGTHNISLTVSDGTAPAVAQNFQIVVANVNDPPTAAADSYSTAEDTTLNVAAAAGVLGNDTDPDTGTTLTAVLDTTTANGALTLNANGSFSYKPNANFHGTDSFTYHAIDDGLLSSNVVTVNITVTDVNDAPVIASITDQVATENTPFSLNLASFVSDADTPLSSLVYAPTTALPADLTLGTTGVLSGTPARDTSVGDFSVGFSVSDGNKSTSATFSLTVIGAGRADLALSISAAPNPVSLNTTATWTFTITNNAPQVSVGGVSLQAVFRGVPFQFDSAPSGCTLTPAGAETQLACVLGALAGGATTQVTIPGRGNVAGDVFAPGTVAIVGPVPIDETPRNDTATGALSVAQGVSATPAQAISGLDARAAAAGDLNGDGFVDLVVAAGPSQSSVVLLNVVDPANANKRVLSGAPISLSDQAANNGIVLADLDGDSDLDVVTATGAGAANGIFLNDGSAAFTAVALGDPNANSRAVAAGDINGDLLTDLVFANSGPSTVHINGSAANFAAPVPIGNADSRGVVLVDLFGDALPELVFANADGGATIYRNAGGTFQLALTLPTGPTTSVAAADFNNDGRFDLVFGRSVAPPSGVPSNLVWLNTSTTAGSFFLSNEIGAAPTTAVAVADFDLDGDTDILVVNETGGHQLYTNVAAASGTFALHPQQIATAGALAAAVGKLSVDDRVDAALVGTNGVAVFYNDGAGNLGSGDITPPTIQLRGEPSITLTVEDSYTDAGATANDTIDGDVTARIVVDNPVNTAVIGTYTITYNATDLSGNSATPVTRSVRVQTRQGTGGGGGGAAGLEFALLLAFVTVIVRLSSRWRFRSMPRDH